MSRTIGILVIAIVVSALSAGFIEGVLRISGYEPRKVWWQWATSSKNHKFRLDPRRIYTLKQDTVVDFEDSVPLQTIDSEGFRASPCSTGSEVWLFVGDSYMYGHGVADGETFPYHVRAALHQHEKDICVVNAGVQGYALGTAYVAFLDALRVNPRVVVWGVKADDLADRLQNGVIDIADSSVTVRGARLNGIYLQGVIDRTLGVVFPKSRLLNLAMYALQTSVVDDAYVRYWKEAFPHFTSYLAGVAKKRGFSLYYVLMPSETMTIDPGAKDKNDVKLHTIIRKTLTEQGSWYLDMNDAIRSANLFPFASDSAMMASETGIFQPDWHLTPAGNKFMASSFVGELLKPVNK